jgi:hypothetical protein
MPTKKTKKTLETRIAELEKLVMSQQGLVSALTETNKMLLEALRAQPKPTVPVQQPWTQPQQWPWSPWQYPQVWCGSIGVGSIPGNPGATCESPNQWSVSYSSAGGPVTGSQSYLSSLVAKS